MTEWKTQIRQCRDCNHLWHGSASINDGLECPECGGMNGFTPLLQQSEEIEALRNELSRIKEGVKGLPIRHFYGIDNLEYIIKQDLDNLMENKK